MKYDFKLDIENENICLKQIINRIQPHRKVLEVGCANGRLTKFLKEQMECEVTIIELDEIAGAQAAQYAAVSLLGPERGNIEKYIWCDEIEKNSYDYIIFADVLEHLINPRKVLEICKDYIKKTGVILISIPNIANNAIVANLLLGNFTYTPIGLLDESHISFFTRERFLNLASDLGYYINYIGATYSKIGENEVPVTMDCLTQEQKYVLLKRENGNIYQNIFEIGKIQKDTEILEMKDVDFYFQSSFFYQFCNENEINPQNVIQRTLKFSDELKYHLEFGQAVQMIRFDPMENSGVVRFEKFLVNGKELDDYDYWTNALHSGHGHMLFDKTDPMIILNLEPCKTIDVEIKYEIVDFDITTSAVKSYYIKELAGEKEHALECSKENERLHEQVNYLQSTLQNEGQQMADIQNALQEKEQSILSMQNELLQKEQLITNMQNTKIWKMYKVLKRVLKRHE